MAYPKRDRWLWGTWAAAILLGAFYLHQALARYAAGYAAIQDFGFFRSALTNIDHGNLFGVLPVAGYPILADHLALVLYPIALLYMAWPTPTFLLALQAFALTLAAIPLYLWAREAAGRRAVAAVVAAVWLLSPWLDRANLFDWHPDALWPLALFGLLLALERRRLVPAAGWFVLALCCKNVLVAPLIGVGAWWWMRNRTVPEGRRWGLAIMLVAGAWFAVAMHLQGVLSPGHVAQNAAFYANLLGGRPSLASGLLFALSHPRHTLAALTMPQGWAQVGLQLALVALAPLFSWAGAAIVAIPALLTGASNYWAIALGQMYYPLALAATAMPPLALWLGQAGGQSIRPRALALTMATALGAAILTLPQWTLAWTPQGPSGWVALAAMVPPAASLATTNDGPGAALADRLTEYVLPPDPGGSPARFYAVASRARYVLWSPMANVPTAVALDVPLAEGDLRGLGYRLVSERQSWQLWRRSAARTDPPAVCRPAGVPVASARWTGTIAPTGEAVVATLHLATRSAVATWIRGSGYGAVGLFGARGHTLLAAGWLNASPAPGTLDVGTGTWHLVVLNPAWAGATHAAVDYRVRELACPTVAR